MAVRIVTDSASCISAEQRAEYGIETVALHVESDGRSLSQAELHEETFYDRLESMTQLPTTSQPTPSEFWTPFVEAVQRGEDVLAILISAEMSGTLQSAQLAAQDVLAQHPNARIQLLDSRSNSLEEGYAVLAAARVAAGGGSIEQCREAAEQTMRRTRFLFTPRSLEYLRRGGRISAASALLGVMLKIAPVLTAENGSTGVAGVGRSGTSAWRKIASVMKRDVGVHGLKRAAVQYVASVDDARRFAAQVIEPIVERPVPITPIHPVVGVHVGPAVGVVYETVEPLR